MRWGLLVVAIVTACSDDDDAPSSDAGADVELDAPAPLEIAPPAPPEAPALPVLTPCPEGWREVADADDPEVVVCDPWPEGGPREDCGEDEAHFAGAPGCERIGSACPKGEWADALPDGLRVLRVQGGAAPGGDGSVELPFATIADALDAAAPGDVVAVGKGTFDEAGLRVDRAVTVWGACAAETVVTGAILGVSPTIELRGDGPRVGNLTVTGDGVGVRATHAVGAAVLEDVVVRDTGASGMVIDAGGDLAARNVLVRRSSSAGGILVGLDGNANLQRAVIEEVAAIGLLVEGTDATCGATDLAVVRTRADPEGALGIGVTAGMGATLELLRTAVTRSTDQGIAAGLPGTHLHAVDLSVTDTQPRAFDGEYGDGIFVSEGASVAIERASLLRNVEAGVALGGPGTSFTAQDLVVADTLPGDPGGKGGLSGAYGVRMVRGGTAEVTRTWIARCQGVALELLSPEALDVTDLTVRATSALDTAGILRGEGLYLEPDPFGERPRAQVALRRARFVDSGVYGILAGGGDVSLSDVAVEGAGDGAGTEAGGVWLDRGATVTVDRLLVAGARVAGLSVNRESTLTGGDVTIRDTSGDAVDGLYGLGLGLSTGAAITLARVSVQDCRTAGVLATGDVASLLRPRGIFEDLRVGGTLEGEGGGGIGIAALLGTVEVTHFIVSDNVLCGVQVTDGNLDLHEGEIRGNPIGANVQDPTYDLARLEDRVRYLDNPRSLDSTEIPVPDVDLAIPDALDP